MLLAAACACDGGAPPPAGKLAPEDPCTGRGDGWWCEEGDALRCAAEASDERVACEDEAVCVVGQGCAQCTPNDRVCEEGELRRCRADGSEWEVLETCAPGLQCTLAGCADLCARAAEERSYVGCEYWPVTTANQSLDEAFVPAVAVGNPNLEPAQVRLERGAMRTDVEVAPGEIEVMALPFQPDLKEPFALTSVEQEGGMDKRADIREPRSLLIEGGAYHLTSDVPVTVHQFNPLQFRTEECADPKNQEEDGCFSYTNDASLLLPTTALTGNYVAVTRPTWVLFGSLKRQRPGFVTVVGTQPEPTTVVVRVRAHVAASASRSHRAFEALAPGDSLTVELGAGDVLQLASAAVGDSCPGESVAEEGVDLIYCDPGRDYDLTGTEIEASGPVEVLAGHDCTFVPFDRWACDHLEESMFPVESWGEQLVVTRPSSANSEVHRIKVLSASDGNRIVVDPPLDRELVLDRGESFEWESHQHVVVTGQAPIAVAQFLVGQDGAKQPGDPSMSLAIPSSQFKRAYDILTPATYDDVYVNVVTAGESFSLDGRQVGGLTRIGSSDFRVTRQAIDEAGLHRIEAGSLAGVVVYGFGRYTSYMVPGGLDLRLLHPPPF